MSKITKTELMTFKTDDLGIELQGTLYQGKPVFFAVKVAEALGYEKPHDALTKHCKSLIKIKYHEMESLGFEPKSNGMSFLSEADLFRLILKSKLPSAERVQDWVCEDVLPALRQHGSYSIKKHHKDEGSGLPEFRKAKALEIQAKAIQIQVENVKKIFEWATNLSDKARQTIIAGLINPIAGGEVIPLPLITEKHYTATEIGKMFNVSANKIGRIANDNEMKVKAYGDTYLDKSPYSNKEVESFRYNEKAIKKFREILVAEQEAAKKRTCLNHY